MHCITSLPTYGLQHYTHKHQLVGKSFDRLSRTKNDKPHTGASERATSARLQTQESTRRAARSATVTAASGPLGNLRRRSAPVRPPDKGCRPSACIFFPTYLIWPTRLPGTQTPLCPSQQKHLPVLHPHLWWGFSFLRTLPLKCHDFKRRFLFILAHE